MNRIHHVDVELAYAILEPGVRQGDLVNHLAEHYPGLMADCTGAGPDTSVIGCLLDRGFGHSEYGDKLLHSAGFEVVIPGGEVMQTGLSCWEGARAAHVFPYGPGPHLHGLFTQSPFGIVTRATVWLMPKPKAFRAVFIALNSADSIGHLVDALRRLRLSGTLRSTVHVFNDMRMLGGFTQFPWDKSDGSAALEQSHPQLCRSMLDDHGIPSWVATASLGGTRAEVIAAARSVRNCLSEVPGIKVSISPEGRTFRFIMRMLKGRLHRYIPTGVFRKLEKMELAFDLLAGVPSRKTLYGAHWRARGIIPEDLDPRSSGSGLIWLSPVAPATNQDINYLLGIMKEIFHKFGFEFQVTLSFVTERAICAVSSIAFDRESPRERSRAIECHDACLEKLLSAGYIPYRASPQTASLMERKQPSAWEFSRRLRDCIDPAHLCSPGKYLGGEN